MAGIGEEINFDDVQIDEEKENGAQGDMNM